MSKEFSTNLEHTFQKIYFSKIISEKKRIAFEKKVAQLHVLEDSIAKDACNNNPPDQQTQEQAEQLRASLNQILEAANKLAKEIYKGTFRALDRSDTSSLLQKIKLGLESIRHISGATALTTDIAYLKIALEHRKPPENFLDKLMEVVSNALVSVVRYLSHLRFDTKASQADLLITTLYKAVKSKAPHLAENIVASVNEIASANNDGFEDVPDSPRSINSPN